MQTSLIKSHAYFSSESASSISFLPSTHLGRTESIKGNHLDRHKGSCLHPSCYSVTSTSEVILHRSLLIFIYFLLFGCTGSQLSHARSLVVACAIYFPDQGSNLGSLHGRLIATGPSGRGPLRVSKSERCAGGEHRNGRGGGRTVLVVGVWLRKW